MRTRCCLPVLVGLLTLGCGGDAPPPTASQASPPSNEAATDDDPTPPIDERPVVVFLGDSLTAGFGLDEHQAFPALVESALSDRDRPIRMINAGVSGDTSAGGLARLDWLLRQAPDIVVVSLGANDGLRGVELASTEANLRAIVERSLATGARVLLSGMQIPPNYGQDYTEGFAALYPRLSTELDVPLV
ncbi:MAG: arylesterase, partial [Acidobacteriota bacterium]